NENITSIDDAITYINTFTASNDTRTGTGVKAVKNKDGSGIDFVNTNSDGTTDSMKNINLVVNSDNTAGEVWTATWTDGQNGAAGSFTKYEQVTQNNASLWTATSGTAGTPNSLQGGRNAQIITAHKYIYSSSAQTLPPMYNPDGGYAYVPGTLNNGTPTWNGTDTASVGSQNYYNAVNGGLLNTNVRTFHTTEDLRELLQRDARYGVDYDGSGTFAAADVNENVKVVVNSSGAFSITNVNETSKSPQLVTGGQGPLDFGPHNMNFNITAYTDEKGTVSTNDAFTKIFKGLDGS
ncbi:flagellar hook protein FlgE, partial [Campylobacter sp. US18a]